MTEWVELLQFSVLPVLAVAMITTINFYGIRKKRGYKTASIGTGILGVGFLVEVFQWFDIPLTKSLLPILQHVGQILQLSGWYIVIIGLVQLHRLIPRRVRMILFSGTLLWVVIGSFPLWVAGVVSGILYMTFSFYLEKWMGYSNVLVVWLLRVLSLSGISLALVDFSFGQLPHVAEWVHATGNIVASSLVLVVVINRVSDVLDRSYRSSITDALTGLYNRKYFYSLIQKYIEKAIEISIIFVDLDNFKKLNDSQGHDAGDDALRVVASILKEESESRGIAGRYGGEEMVMVITQEKFDMESLGERIRQRIEKESPVTASIGFATWIRGITAKEFVDRADKAMYHSKTTGKNKVTGFV
jgi:two-component system cell cycle response regulator